MEEVIGILESVRPDVDYDSETGLIDKRILDSFDVVNIVGELMDTFDIEINAEHMIPENFNSAQAIFRLVAKLQED